MDVDESPNDCEGEELDIYYSDSEEEFEEFEVSKDDSKVIISEHEEGVMCVITNKAGSVAISGGMDDRVAVWRIDNGLLLCQNREIHLETVTHLGLSKSEKFLASGDLEGVVIIWKIKNNPMRLEKVTKITMLKEVVSLEWFEDTLFVCDNSGLLESWKNDVSKKLYEIGKGCCCVGMKVINKATHLVRCYGGDCAYHEDCCNRFEVDLFDIATNQTRKSDLRNHVRSDDFGSCVVSKEISGGTVMGINDGDQLLIINISANGQFKQTQVFPLHSNAGVIECLSFCDTLSFLSYSTSEGAVGTFDYTRRMMRSSWEVAQEGVNTDGGVVNLMKWVPQSPLLVTVTKDSRIFVWDGRSPTKPLTQLTGHTKVIWDMTITENGKTLITGSEDTTCRVFNI